MNDREFLESLHTQLSNHLVMPDASKGLGSLAGGPVPVAVNGGDLERNENGKYAKAHFGPGTSTWRFLNVKAGEILHLEVADAHEAAQVTIYGPSGLHWQADPAPLIAGAGQVLPAPTAPMDGTYAVEVTCATPGTLWWP